jgi:hypothetical protein
MAVSLTDWILLGVLLASMLVGLWRGLVYEVLSLAGWVAAFYVSQMYAPAAAAWLPMDGSSQMLRYAAGFVVVFVAVLVGTAVAVGGGGLIGVGGGGGGVAGSRKREVGCHGCCGHASGAATDRNIGAVADLGRKEGQVACRADACLAGIAMRKTGLKPGYLNPVSVDHGLDAYYGKKN